MTVLSLSQRKRALLATGTLVVSTIALVSAQRAPKGPNEVVRCSFPDGDRTSVDTMIKSIEEVGPACGLPWRALKRIANDSVALGKLEDTYRAFAKNYPDREFSARARLADVEAAAGDPTNMLKIADENVRAHPEDPSLRNAQCYVRSAHGFDREHVLEICDAAVAAFHMPYTLVHRGKAELSLGLYDKALADFEEALNDPSFRRHPFIVDALFGRGIARVRMGDVKGQDDIALSSNARPSVIDDFADAGIIL